MSVCIEEIRKEITTVQQETGNISFKVEKSINTFLDAVLDIQKDIQDVTKSINDLYTILHDDFPNFTPEDISYIDNDYQSVINELNHLYAKLRKSKFHVAYKTDLKELLNSIDNIKELYNDLHLFKVDLPQNDNFKSIINQLNAI